MFAKGSGGVRCSEPCTSSISVDSLRLVKGLDCLMYEGTGEKNKLLGAEVGGGRALWFSKSHVYTALDEG